MPYAFQVDLSSEEMHDLKKPDTIVIHDLLMGAVKGDDADEDCDDDDERTQSCAGIYAKGVFDDAIADYHDKDGQCLNQQLKIIMKITV